MIKLKDILLESTAPDIFIPRRTEDRLERMVKQYIRNGSKGNLDVSDLKLIVLPDMLKDISVSEDFYCGNNNLTSLINAPKSVGGSFFCVNNDIKSLEGVPKTVGGSFDCSYNNLTTLEGAPTSVGGYFSCSNNPVQFTRKGVKSVCDVKGRIFV
jgi:hypothetical protein